LFAGKRLNPKHTFETKKNVYGGKKTKKQENAQEDMVSNNGER